MHRHFHYTKHRHHIFVFCGLTASALAVVLDMSATHSTLLAFVTNCIWLFEPEA